MEGEYEIIDQNEVIPPNEKCINTSSIQTCDNGSSPISPLQYDLISIHVQTVDLSDIEDSNSISKKPHETKDAYTDMIDEIEMDLPNAFKEILKVEEEVECQSKCSYIPITELFGTHNHLIKWGTITPEASMVRVRFNHLLQTRTEWVHLNQTVWEFKKSLDLKGVRPSEFGLVIRGRLMDDKALIRDYLSSDGAVIDIVYSAQYRKCHLKID